MSTKEFTDDQSFQHYFGNFATRAEKATDEGLPEDMAHCAICNAIFWAGMPGPARLEVCSRPCREELLKARARVRKEALDENERERRRQENRRRNERRKKQKVSSGARLPGRP